MKNTQSFTYTESVKLRFILSTCAQGIKLLKNSQQKNVLRKRYRFILKKSSKIIFYLT